MRISLIITFCFMFSISYGQKKHSKQSNVISYQNKIDTSLVFIDTLLGDTIIYHKYGRFTKTNKNGILLIEGKKEGGMSSKCGCEPMANGYWIERYANGKLKEQGTYDCGRKINTWIYYYDNGQIRKVENYKYPYNEMFIKNTFLSLNLKKGILKEGTYLEYHRNGKIKIEGEYEILEENSKQDTIYITDKETYERIPKINQGNFWIARSKKKGWWNYYSENGVKESSIYYNFEGNNFRSIESRYLEIIERLKELLKSRK